MGEKIKTLASGRILQTEFETELNHPLSIGRDQQIHIQSDSFRFEMDKKDYIKYALTILVADKNLRNLKGIK
jgi:hypothetical protein